MVYATRFFFFNDTATTEIYTLSLHDALPISCSSPTTTCTRRSGAATPGSGATAEMMQGKPCRRSGKGTSTTSPSESGTWCSIDRKSTRLNSSHANISYAVFCLKKKNNISSAPVLHVKESITQRRLQQPLRGLDKDALLWSHHYHVRAHA